MKAVLKSNFWIFSRSGRKIVKAAPQMVAFLCRIWYFSKVERLDSVAACYLWEVPDALRGGCHILYQFLQPALENDGVLSGAKDES